MFRKIERKINMREEESRVKDPREDVTHTHIQIHTLIHPHTHTKHIQIHTLIHTHTHTHSHIHTYRYTP